MLPEPPSAAQSPTSTISPPTSSPVNTVTSPHTSPHTSPVTSPHTSPSTSVAMSPLGRVLPPMRSAHFHHLKELNWQVRLRTVSA